MQIVLNLTYIQIFIIINITLNSLL